MSGPRTFGILRRVPSDLADVVFLRRVRDVRRSVFVHVGDLDHDTVVHGVVDLEALVVLDDARIARGAHPMAAHGEIGASVAVDETDRETLGVSERVELDLLPVERSLALEPEAEVRVRHDVELAVQVEVRELELVRPEVLVAHEVASPDRNRFRPWDFRTSR